MVDKKSSEMLDYDVIGQKTDEPISLLMNLHSVIYVRQLLSTELQTDNRNLKK